MPEESTPNLTIPRLTKSWYVRHRILAFALILLCLGGVIAFTYRPIIAAWKHKNALKLVQLAQYALDDRAWTVAAPLLMRAYVSDPTNPIVLRECAYYERVGAKNPVLTGIYLNQLISLGHATSEDRAYMGQSFMAQGEIAKARNMLTSILASERRTRAALELESMIAQKDGDHQRSIEILRQALALEPDNPECLLKLALMDLEHPAMEFQEKAINSLWTIAHSSAEESLLAIEKLTAHPLLSAPQSEKLLALLDKKLDATPKLRYAAVSSYIRLHPLEKEAVLKREIARIPADKDEEFSELCRWLIFQSECDLVLKIISRENAASKVQLYPCYVEALVRKQSWAELKDFLVNSKSLPTSLLDVLQLRAQCAYSLNEPSASVADLLNQARQIATRGRDFKALEHLANQAHRMGQLDIAIDCLQATASTAPEAWKTNLEQIFTFQRLKGDVSAMLSTLKELNSIKGQANTHLEDLIYLKLISGIDLETVMEECDVYASNGSITPGFHDFFKALDAYRNDDPAGLKISLEIINPKKLPSNWRAVYAGMLASTGDHANAFQIAEKISINTLMLDDEKIIFQKAL